MKPREPAFISGCNHQKVIKDNGLARSSKGLDALRGWGANPVIES
jgi:hypothetical protein